MGSLKMYIKWITLVPFKMTELFTYMEKDWIRVKWLCLSEPNGTPMGKAYEDYDRFLWEMTKHHKTHIHWRWGADLGFDAHAHMIVSVPVDEHERFMKRDSTFKAWSKFPFKQVWYQPWENGHQTEGYACEKHTRMPDRTRCPKRSSACRRGSCTHNIAC